MSPFAQKIYSIVKKIPEGEVMTYKEVAEAVGRPKAYRAVGNVLNKNYDPAIPCHRVIRSNGEFGGYNKGEAAKRARLEKERVMTKV